MGWHKNSRAVAGDAGLINGSSGVGVNDRTLLILSYSCGAWLLTQVKKTVLYRGFHKRGGSMYSILQSCKTAALQVFARVLIAGIETCSPPDPPFILLRGAVILYQKS